MTLKSGLEVIEMVPFESLNTVSYLHSINKAAMAVPSRFNTIHEATDRHRAMDASCSKNSSVTLTGFLRSKP